MFTLTIYFIALTVYVKFVLIYRPHPVYDQIYLNPVFLSYSECCLL